MLAPWRAASAADDAYCGALPPMDFEQPPHQPRRGHYDNPNYGYALTLPRGLTAHTSGSAAERGIGIVLSWHPRAYLAIDAVYDVFYDITADGVHRRDLNAIHLHDRVLGDQRRGALLAGSRGARFLTQVQCPDDPQTYLHDDLIVVRGREIYRLNLQTVPERYAADLKVLQALARSWRWRPPPH